MAAAELCGAGSSERWIFYDQSFIDAAKTNGARGDWPRYFILAHEVAHHINGDTLFGSDWNKAQELPADYSAAVWLTRLGASEEKLMQAFDALGFPLQSVNGYPTQAERRAKVTQGYDDTQLQSGADPRPARDPMVPDPIICMTCGDRWTDSRTGLMWTKSDNRAPITQPKARNYYLGLKIAGITGWRLPEYGELAGGFRLERH